MYRCPLRFLHAPPQKGGRELVERLRASFPSEQIKKQNSSSPGVIISTSLVAVHELANDINNSANRSGHLLIFAFPLAVVLPTPFSVRRHSRSTRVESGCPPGRKTVHARPHCRRPTSCYWRDRPFQRTKAATATRTPPRQSHCRRDTFPTREVCFPAKRGNRESFMLPRATMTLEVTVP